MKYKEEQQLEIGRKILESGRTNLDVAMEYGISEESARRYRIKYEKSIGIVRNSDRSSRYSTPSEAFDKSVYEEMSREQLLEELMKTKINEARLKKGYMVKGDGAEKEYFLSDNRNTK